MKKNDLNYQKLYMGFTLLINKEDFKLYKINITSLKSNDITIKGCCMSKLTKQSKLWKKYDIPSFYVLTSLYRFKDYY